jgi:hypothetical protein
VCGGQRTEEDEREVTCRGCRHALGDIKNEDSGGELGKEGKIQG